jgi:hypothetical protein
MNNFDMSSTGTNLELSCFYDIDEGRFHLEESIVQINGYWVFTAHGSMDVSTWHKEYELIESFKDTCVKIIKENYNGSARNFLEDYLMYCHGTYRDRDDELLVEFITEYSSCSDNASDYVQPSNFDTCTVIGYSQGDIEEVVIPRKLHEILGTNGDSEIFAKDIGHMFWDTPVFCRLTINFDDDEAHQLDQYLDDHYEWDKDKILKEFECSPDVKDWLRDNLPDEPVCSY